MSVGRAGGRGGGDLEGRPPGQVGAAAAQLKPSVVMGMQTYAATASDMFKVKPKPQNFM